MKTIRIKRTEILRLLSEGSVFAGRNRAMKILNNVRITTNRCRMRVESSSEDNYIRVYGSCLEETEDVAFCINAKELSNYISLINDDDITIGVDEDKAIINIKHSNGKMNAPYYIAE